MSEAALTRAVEDELALFSYPTADWVRPVAGPDGTPVWNVVIVGAGQAGLATAFGLQRERIGGVTVIDENPDGMEGPWITYARMITLRTLKFLTGPDLGFPSLTFRRWHAARYGEAAWDGLVRIDKADWMRYLVWFRRTLKLPVRNGTRLLRIEPASAQPVGGQTAGARPDAAQPSGREPAGGAPSGALWALDIATPAGTERMLTREVVLATGLDGAGGRRVPEFVRQGLRPGEWAHTADPIDFASLRGRRVAVIGGGASAYDNAATALEAGAARVDLFVRRAAVPQINPFRALESAGFWRGFASLDDAIRWRFMYRLFSFPMPPPLDSIERVVRHDNASVHFSAPILDAAPGPRLRTPAGWHDADFVILGTGFDTDLTARPELAPIAPTIANWAHRYIPPPDRCHDEMARHPYLGSGYELMAKTGDPGSPLRRIRMFNGGAMVSAGPTATGLNGMPFGLPRLIHAISLAFLRDQAAAQAEDFDAYDEPDAWEAVRSAQDAAG